MPPSSAARSIPGMILGIGLRRSVWVPCAGGLVLALGPQFIGLTSYELHLMTSVFMYAALASSLNVIAGYVGYADFGNVVFFGIGAYATAVLAHAGWSIPLGMLAGALVAGACALFLGWPLLRLRGHYFAIATLGVLGLAQELAANLTGVTRGGQGLSLPLFKGSAAAFNVYNYYAMGILAGLIILASAILRRSRFGYATRALHADEDAAAIVGVFTTRVKMLAWAVSAAMSGIVGGAFAYWSTYITPQSVFDITVSTTYFIMMLFGGAGTVWGPVFGAVILELLTDVTWHYSLGFSTGMLGLAIVVIVLFLPNGFLPWAASLGHRKTVLRQ